MHEPTLIDIPHTLGKEEARRRVRERTGLLPSHIPGGVAEVKTTWLSEDSMALEVVALGQRLCGTVEVQDRFLRLSVAMPPGLSFMSGMISSAIRREGSSVLLGDDGHQERL